MSPESPEHPAPAASGHAGSVAALLAEVARPEDPEAAQRVSDIRARASRAQSLLDAGRYRDAMTEVDALIADAQPIGYRPLVAELCILRGRLRWSSHYNNVGVVYLAREQPEPARRYFERVLAARPPDDRRGELASVGYNLMLITDDHARRDELLRDTLAGFERTLGAAHPRTLNQRVISSARATRSWPSTKGAWARMYLTRRGARYNASAMSAWSALTRIKRLEK